MSDTHNDDGNDKNETGSVQGQKNLTYNSHLEHLISSEAEKALVLFWLHDQSE